jgi:hypothetical protein
MCSKCGSSTTSRGDSTDWKAKKAMVRMEYADYSQWMINWCRYLLNFRQWRARVGDPMPGLIAGPHPCADYPQRVCSAADRTTRACSTTPTGAAESAPVVSGA